MALETSTYIDGLVATNPTAADPKNEGDDHLRLLKSTIKASFPNVAGAVAASHAELSLMDGMLVQPAAKDGSNLTTPAAGDNSTAIATTEFVTSAALSSALPGQAGNAGKFIQTDGTTATWEQVYPVLSIATNGLVLTNDGSSTSWTSMDARGNKWIDKGNSGTTAQVVNFTDGEWQKITVTGAFTLSTSGWIGGRGCAIAVKLVNPGANVTFSGINWKKFDGSTTTTFADLGITLQTVGTEQFVFWRDGDDAVTYGKVVR